ncbi:MAG: dTDP-4-amino-4,6-dideoxygalactose transaminase [Firmicutes bacterium]|nr:dTDP-4-amino-4,6-dideoxygalactose transaminase [Bacillota bacterium]
MIPFNKASITKIENEYVFDALSKKLCGDGEYTRKVYNSFLTKLQVKNMLLTTSCSHALDMTAILADIKKDDEIIVPSYTFVSTVNAFALRGAKPVFCEIEKETMNIDANKIEELITSKTKAIYPVHYAGVICDMDKIIDIARRHNLMVIEDAAQAVGSVYKGNYPAGTIGDMGCYSFHETKNYSMGEGGAIIVKDKEIFKQAEIIREKGTDRSQFIRGEVDKYTWKAIGSSFLPSDILAAMLYGQIERFDEIMQKRMNVWNAYNDAFEELEKKEKLIRPYVPEYSTHNAHMYYIILPTKEVRDDMIIKLREKGVQSVFHYMPLHTSPMGEKFGYKEGNLPITEEYAGRLLRLPMWADLSEDEVLTVINAVRECC